MLQATRDPSFLDRLKQIDHRRPSFPGEHWAAFGTGAMFLRWGLRSRSPLMKLAALAIGAGLVWRAASGRDGALAELRSHDGATEVVR